MRDAGHDVRAVDEDRGLEGLEDPAVLELAASEGRILVTFDAKDFVPLLGEWTRRGKTHSGCILVPGSVSHEYFGIIIAGIADILGDSSQEEWKDRVEWLRRS